MMNKISLYHCHETRSMRVLWLLNELDLDYDLHVMPFDGLRNQEYQQIHPLARVPSIEFNGEVMFESLAICQYLCEQISPTRLARMHGHSERAAWLQWINYSETMAVHAANLVQQYIVIQPSALQSETVIKLERRRLEKTIDLLEQALQQKAYLLGSEFTLADIAVGYSLHLASKFVDLSRWPTVETYFKGLFNREAFNKSLPSDDAEFKVFTQNYLMT